MRINWRKAFDILTVVVGAYFLANGFATTGSDVDRLWPLLSIERVILGLVSLFWWMRMAQALWDGLRHPPPHVVPEPQPIRLGD